jgi:hypothetical protein
MTDATTLARDFPEGAQFSVRTFEKGAHLRRNPRSFPRCALSKPVRTLEGIAHLPGRALDPVPLMRKVVLPLVSASMDCLETKAGAMPRR